MSETATLNVERSGPDQVPRRAFLDRFIVGSMLVTAASYLVGIVAFLSPAKKSDQSAEAPTDAGPLADLPVGQGKVVQHGDQPVLVIRGEEGVAGLSAVCTHLGCIVRWDGEGKLVRCPCHAAVFDARGNVVSGPPPSPLPAVPVSVVKDHIMVGGST